MAGKGTAPKRSETHRDSTLFEFGLGEAFPQHVTELATQRVVV